MPIQNAAQIANDECAPNTSNNDVIYTSQELLTFLESLSRVSYTDNFNLISHRPSIPRIYPCEIYFNAIALSLCSQVSRLVMVVPGIFSEIAFLLVKNHGEIDKAESKAADAEAEEDLHFFMKFAFGSMLFMNTLLLSAHYIEKKILCAVLNLKHNRLYL